MPCVHLKTPFLNNAILECVFAWLPLLSVEHDWDFYSDFLEYKVKQRHAILATAPSKARFFGDT
jgi:hypothetical protein